MDPELKAYLDSKFGEVDAKFGESDAKFVALEDRLMQRIEQSESAMDLRIGERIEKSENNLLRAFHGWSRSMEISMRGVNSSVARPVN